MVLFKDEDHGHKKSTQVVNLNILTSVAEPIEKFKHNHSFPPGVRIHLYVKVAFQFARNQRFMLISKQLIIMLFNAELFIGCRMNFDRIFRLGIIIITLIGENSENSTFPLS